MAGACTFARMLCATAVILLAAAASSAPHDKTDSLTPPAIPSEKIAGQIVPCSQEEKKCLDRNKILFEEKCYTVGARGPCRMNEILVLDKDAFEQYKSVRAECRNIQCDKTYIFGEFQERMTHDQRCYNLTYITTHICSQNKNLSLRKNVFGEGQCEYISNSTEIYDSPKQPLQYGQCYIPYFSFKFNYKDLPFQLTDQFKVQHALLNLTIKCSEKQRQCLESDKVLFPGDGQCHSLLARGPCQPGSWLVLDQGALEAQRELVAVCAGPRCLPGQLFMAAEQRCRAFEELQSELCAAEDFLFDVFGEAHCGRFTDQKLLLLMPKQQEGDTCILYIPRELGGAEGKLLSNCGADDNNKCSVEAKVGDVSPSFQ